MTQLTENIYAVKVPKKIAHFYKDKFSNDLVIQPSYPELESFIIINFDYQIIGLASQFTEELAKSILPKLSNNRYLKYSLLYDTVDTALESFHSLLISKELYIKNPFSYEGKTKPKGDIEVSYDNGKTWDDSVDWMDSRICMMAGIARGYGYFGEGWGSTGSNGCDRGLICDDPDYWRKIDEIEKWQQYQSKVSDYLIIEKVK